VRDGRRQYTILKKRHFTLETKFSTTEFGEMAGKREKDEISLKEFEISSKNAKKNINKYMKRTKFKRDIFSDTIAVDRLFFIDFENIDFCI
jgi:hypothetical protein